MFKRIIFSFFILESSGQRYSSRVRPLDTTRTPERLIAETSRDKSPFLGASLSTRRAVIVPSILIARLAGSTSTWKNVEHVDVEAREERREDIEPTEARGAELPRRVTMET